MRCFAVDSEVKINSNIILVVVIQLQEQLDAVDSILHLCAPQLKLRLQDLQQEVVERWEELRLHTEQRERDLKLACQRYLFLNTVRAGSGAA